MKVIWQKRYLALGCCALRASLQHGRRGGKRGAKQKKYVLDDGNGKLRIPLTIKEYGDYAEKKKYWGLEGGQKKFRHPSYCPKAVKTFLGKSP